MSVSMSDHDRDCPCFEDRFGKCNCKAQLIADFVAEIAQLRTALDESVTREAALTYALSIMVRYEKVTRYATADEPSETKYANALLSNPTSSAKSLLRDRERLAVFMQGEIYLHQDTEYAYRLFWRCPEGLDVALSDCKKTKTEAVDAAMPNQLATPDVVAGGDGDPK